MEEAIEAGRRAARAAKDRLARYSVSESEYEKQRARQRRPPVRLPVIDAIRIENHSPLSDRVIEARINTRPSEPLDLGNCPTISDACSGSTRSNGSALIFAASRRA